MLGQTDSIVIMNNSINNMCLVFLLGVILVICFITYIVLLECNRKKLDCLTKYKKELQEAKRMKMKKKNG